MKYLGEVYSRAQNVVAWLEPRDSKMDALLARLGNLSLNTDKSVLENTQQTLEQMEPHELLDFLLTLLQNPLLGRNWVI